MFLNLRRSFAKVGSLRGIGLSRVRICRFQHRSHPPYSEWASWHQTTHLATQPYSVICKTSPHLFLMIGELIKLTIARVSKYLKNFQMKSIAPSWLYMYAAVWIFSLCKREKRVWETESTKHIANANDFRNSPQCVFIYNASLEKSHILVDRIKLKYENKAERTEFINTQIMPFGLRAIKTSGQLWRLESPCFRPLCVGIAVPPWKRDI